MEEALKREIEKIADRSIKDLALYLAYYARDQETEAAEVIEYALRYTEEGKAWKS